MNTNHPLLILAAMFTGTLAFGADEQLDVRPALDRRWETSYFQVQQEIRLYGRAYCLDCGMGYSLGASL